MITYTFNQNGLRRSNSDLKTYILSMGHRIHILTYDTNTQTVNVKRFLLRDSYNTDPSNRFQYKYQLWVPQSKQYQCVNQTFHKFPTPEYNWNFLDELICGYYDELNPS